MRPRPGALAIVVLLASDLGAAALPAAPPVTLVACAPGYPGSTAEAQPTMDAFAAAAGAAAGWAAGELAAVYHETEAAGSERLTRSDAALALVPLPFYLAHRRELALAARLEVVPQGGAAAETWSLVAHRGSVARPADLDGWELASLAAYAPGFVRGVALAGWGVLPGSVKLVPTGAVLSGLRRAAAGEQVALLLDSAQARALPSLPFARELEIVATSPALPGSLLCTVGKRLPEGRARALVEALQKLDADPAGAAALAGLRMTRFAALDAAGLARAEKAFDAAPP